MIRKLLLFLFLVLSGCTTGSFFSIGKSNLEIHSMGLNRIVLLADCDTIVCTEGFANEGDIWMTDIPMDQIQNGNILNGQIIHLQVLWTPVAGKTPLASTSTNLAIEHIIISNGNVGIYGGGGYCWKYGNPEDGMHLLIEDATIAIHEQSADFADLLTPATMNGSVRSIPDTTLAKQIAAAANLLR